MSHDAVHAQMDVKLRSLICLGLNEQVSLVIQSLLSLHYDLALKHES